MRMVLPEVAGDYPDVMGNVSRVFKYITVNELEYKCIFAINNFPGMVNQP